MTVIYNMSIDRADKPWIGDRRLTELYTVLLLSPAGDILNTLKNNTQCCGVVVTPVNLLRASREHLGRGWLVVEHRFGGV